MHKAADAGLGIDDGAREVFGREGYSDKGDCGNPNGNTAHRPGRQRTQKVVWKTQSQDGLPPGIRVYIYCRLGKDQEIPVLGTFW